MACTAKYLTLVLDVTFMQTVKETDYLALL
jgi:hypothetical protein